MGGGKNRRTSSGASAAEQARIAEMYKTVIKMSSENVSPTNVGNRAVFRRIAVHNLLLNKWQAIISNQPTPRTPSHLTENQRKEFLEPRPD